MGRGHPTDSRVSRPAPPRAPSARPWLLRSSDQAVVAALVLLALVALAVAYLGQGGCQGRLAEINDQPARSAVFQVDINTADWPEIAQLPGIGETLARRIVAFRQEHGPFRSIDELDRVRGIGPKKLAQIRPYLRPVPADVPPAERP